MNLTYQLTSEDFLEYQLYNSSKSKLHQKRRFRSRIFVPIIYIVFGLYLTFTKGDSVNAILFSSFAILWFAFYPKYSRWRYKRHFKKHIEENFQNRINTDIEVVINQDSIFTKDYTSEGTINGAELHDLTEIKDHFFIRLNSGMSLIIPKHAIDDMELFKSKIISVGAKYVDDRDWTWK